MNKDNFINVPFDKDNLDRVVVRQSILKAINTTLPQLKGSLLDMGCGQMPYRSYILDNSKVESYTGVDIESEFGYHKQVKPDFFWDGERLPFNDQTYDCIFCTEVLEHVPHTINFLKEAYRVLKPDGIFFFTTPFLWPLHDIPHDEYRLTPFSMDRFLSSSGFNQIEIKALGGWHASMAQILGLWVKRSPLSKKRKRILSPIIKWVMKKLMNADSFTKTTFSESSMITGIYGVAKK